METKNICGKIPVELHEKVREELEGTEMTIPQFLQKVIEEHFMKKGPRLIFRRRVSAGAGYYPPCYSLLRGA